MSCHQPWASLIARGRKNIETRSWSTRYRGPLAIHAAQRRPEVGLAVGGYRVSRPRAPKDAPFSLWFHAVENGRGGQHAVALPLGAVVATCELTDVVPIVSPDYTDRRPRGNAPTKVATVRLDRDDRDEHGDPFARVWTYGEITPSQGCWSSGHGESPAYGDFTPGRFAWLLDKITPFDPPVPAKGRQGLWKWTP